MTSKIIKYVLWAGMFVCALSVSRFVTLLDAQQSGTSATDAMQKARVLDRLAATDGQQPAVNHLGARWAYGFGRSLGP